MTVAQRILTIAWKQFMDEFSEWDLTIVVWRADKKAFGMPGYPEFPDHKRVYMELVGRKFISSKLMERTRPNHYRLTPLGKAQAAALMDGSGEHLFKVASSAAHDPDFLKWLDDPSHPKHDPKRPIEISRGNILNALRWCKGHDVDFVVGQTDAIHVRTLSQILDYYTALEYRFGERKNAPKKR